MPPALPQLGAPSPASTHHSPRATVSPSALPVPGSASEAPRHKHPAELGLEI